MQLTVSGDAGVSAHLVKLLSVESWPGVLQITQKHIRGFKLGLEAEMGFPVSEAYSLPVNEKTLVGSVMASQSWKPLSITHGDGRGIQPDDTNRQSLLGTQVRTTGSNVAPLTQTVEEGPEDCTKGTTS